MKHSLIPLLGVVCYTAALPAPVGQEGEYTGETWLHSIRSPFLTFSLVYPLRSFTSN
jgi:hypothetical protein